jgi:AbrB family looped-hinge helix DNA binding protein
METKVSSKGQIVLPKPVRDALGWTAGTKLEVVPGRSEVTLKIRDPLEDRFPPITIDEFFARIPRVNTPLPDDREIDEILLAEAARRYDASRD